jgi:hypothetical protein
MMKTFCGVDVIASLVVVSLVAMGCSNKNQGGGSDKTTDTKKSGRNDEGYMLRHTRPDKVGQIIRTEKYLQGSGSSLYQSKKANRSSDDEYVDKEITELEVTACREGKASEIKVRYLDDSSWEKKIYRGGESKSKYADGRFKGETVWARKGVGGDWDYTLIGNEPTDAQRKRLKGMGKASPGLYPDRRLKEGDTWTVDLREHPQFGMSEGVELTEGQLTLEFENLFEVTLVRLGFNKETCAKINVAGKARGKLFSGGDVSVSLDVRGTIFRSIEKQLDVEQVWNWTLKIDGTSANDQVGLIHLTMSKTMKETVFQTMK